jgi:diguanylate cyclase (GGDEF)-like protein/PAS domain S-box-containing protein
VEQKASDARNLSSPSAGGEELSRAILEHTPNVAIQGYDADGRVAFWNRASEELYGFSAERVIGRRLGGLILSEADAAEFEALIRQVLASGRAAPLREWRTRTASGEARDILSSIFPVGDGAGARVVCMDVDITRAKRLENTVRESNLLLENVFESMHVMVAYLDTDFNFIRVNRAFAEDEGREPDYFVGRNYFALYPGAESEAIFRRVVATGEPYTAQANPFEFADRPDRGVTYWDWALTPVKDEGRVTGLVHVLLNVTERVRTQERLQFLAYHDALTQLPNRALFLDRLGHSLARASRSPRSRAVMFLDVDRFKLINDTLGHDVGDRLLQAFAQRLKACVRDGDTVARVSGDEFAILLEDLASGSDAAVVSRKILEALSTAFPLAGREVYVTTSIGISIHPVDGKDATALLKHADTAMYRAKEAGRNTYRFYSADMGARAAERLTFESGLRRALERDQFLLHYQPLVDLKSGRIVAAEALLRWRHPQLGLVPPAEFIPLLEETGLILPVGEWVIRTAAVQSRAWRARLGHVPRVSVNLSARQFSAPEQAAALARLIEDHCGDGGLDFEITENVVMTHTPAVLEALTRLRQRGCRLVIDDFGTGYSSLAYLRRFPVHALKIDRSFVQDVPQDQDDAAIVTTIVNMAHGLKLEVVAEGVETEAQLSFVRACGCDCAQGYLFGRPLPGEEFERLLAKDRARPPAP